MHGRPLSASASSSHFESIFNSALDAYKIRTRQHLSSHPFISSLQACDSPDAVLAVLREQIPAFGQSQSGDERFSKWLIPTVNVLYAFSATLIDGVGLVFSPANLIFAGIGILFQAAKNASASQDKLIDLFSRIECFFLRLDIYTTVPPSTAMTSIIVDIMVEVLTILAIATKEMKHGRFRTYVRQMVGNTDIEDSLQRLDKLTQEEARMASAELMKITHSIDDKLVGVDDGIKGIDERVQDVRGDVQIVGSKVEDVKDKVQSVEHKLDDTNRNYLRDSLLRWLLPPDPSTNHNIACKAQHEGTAEWFFQGNIFNEWKSTGSFIWIHGKPGSGKSILCSSIIQNIMSLRDMGKASIAYFYFDFRDVNKQKLNSLLPSLLIQLSSRSELCCDILVRLYSAHDRGVQKPSDHAMIECLKEMLTIETHGPTYIIIDALDECPIASSIPSPREEVLEFVNDLVDLHLPNIHICVTSRPELDIQAVLEPLTLHPVSLHDETGQKQDIINYVGAFVYSDRRMRRWRNEDKDLVIKTLSEKAGGMFRWVYCQLEVLRHCFPPSVRHILEELPDSLDETYGRILREIRKANQGYAHRLLQCLVAAVRPLRVEELAEVLAFDFKAEGIPKLNSSWRWEDQEEAVMSVCSSLVTVVKDEDSRIVQFSHFSVKEYLTSSRLAESSRDVSCYHVLLEPAHIIIVQACLGILLRLDDRISEDSITNYPLAQYAAGFWDEHALFGNVSSYIKDAMKCLFDADKPHFATWLWIYNHDYGQSMPTTFPEKPPAVPLYCAVRLGFHDLAEHLLAEHPEDIHAKGGYEVTLLHASVSGGHTDIFSLLIELFPDVEIRGICNQTPLHRASRHGHLEIGQRLLNRGADVNAQDEGGWTPLYLTAVYGQIEFARMLLEQGASVDASTHSGDVPLHAASRYERFEIVRLLLDHGADLNVCNDLGQTPLQEVSVAQQQQAMVRLLSEYDAKRAAV